MKSLFSIVNLVLILCFYIPSIFSVVVIGGSGVLGTNIVRKFCSSPLHQNIWASFKKEEELTSIVSHDAMKAVQFFKLDFLEGNNREPPGLPNLSLISQTDQHRILINSAGVCLQGNSRDALHDSLLVNTIGPIAVAKLFIEESLTVAPSQRISVINISSGDGETCNLNSQVAHSIESINSSTDLDTYIVHLMDSYDSSVEYAHGPTPMYSLSKALLNKSTILMHAEHRPKLVTNQFLRAHKHANIMNGCMNSLDESIDRFGATTIELPTAESKVVNTATDTGVRILACCPGNIASPMSTPEEMLTTVPVSFAAAHIYELATNFVKFPGGKFYRHGELISW